MTSDSPARGSLFEVGADGEVRQYVIEQDKIVVGRSVDCDITLAHPTVSRQHAVITTVDGCTVADLGSANVTRLNGSPIGLDPVPLADGDIIKIGACSLRYRAPDVDDGKTQLLGHPMNAELATAILTGGVGEFLLSAPASKLKTDGGADTAVSVVLSGHRDPCLLVTEDGRTRSIALKDLPLTIGRGAACRVVLKDVRSSREHARVEQAGDQFLLRDLGSANGTLVNGVRTAECLLQEGDTIRIGSTTLIVRTGAARMRDAQSTGTGGALGRMPVVVVPGLCGSELYKDAARIWPNYLRSAACSEEEFADHWGDLTAVRITRDNVVVPGLIKMEGFGRLLDFLCNELGYTAGGDLLEFPYDWRQDIRAGAELLSERVDAWRRSLPNPRAQVVFIAHSMGGLLCRYYLEQLGGVDVCARLILLGTPNRGTTRIFNTTVSGRGALSLPIGVARVKKLMSHFPSVYQMMPAFPSIRFENGDVFFPYDDDSWLPDDCKTFLADGRTFRKSLRDTERMEIPTTCVFGYGQRTLVELVVRRERDGSLKALQEIFDDAGDDAVMEASAVLDRAEIHPVQQRHGALYTDKDVQRRLRYELLERRRALAGV